MTVMILMTVDINITKLNVKTVTQPSAVDRTASSIAVRSEEIRHSTVSVTR
jgi:hypothetical protein